jgi:hypothetical protein
MGTGQKAYSDKGRIERQSLIVELIRLFIIIIIGGAVPSP